MSAAGPLPVRIGLLLNANFEGSLSISARWARLVANRMVTISAFSVHQRMLWKGCCRRSRMVRFASRRNEKQGIVWISPAHCRPAARRGFFALCQAAYMMQCPRVMRDDDLRLAFGRRAPKTPLESICGYVYDNMSVPPAHAPAGRMHACRAPYL